METLQNRSNGNTLVIITIVKIERPKYEGMPASPTVVIWVNPVIRYYRVAVHMLEKELKWSFHENKHK